MTTFYTTKAGVRIGLLYIPPPARMIGDAMKLQAAFLEPKTTQPMSRLRWLAGRIWAWL